jgi:hypothetical protein
LSFRGQSQQSVRILRLAIAIYFVATVMFILGICNAVRGNRKETEMPNSKPRPATRTRIEEALALLNEELDETVKCADAEDGTIDPQRSAALEDKEAGLNAAIYVLEQVQGWADSYGI